MKESMAVGFFFSFFEIISFHTFYFKSLALAEWVTSKRNFFFPTFGKTKDKKKKKFGGLIFIETWRSFISCVALCCRLTASSSCRRGSGQKALTSHITHIHPSLHPKPSAASFSPCLNGVPSKGRLPVSLLRRKPWKWTKTVGSQEEGNLKNWNLKKKREEMICCTL